MATNIAIANFKVEKLNNSNYAIWLVQIMLVLIKEGTWAYVECSKTKDSFILSGSSLTTAVFAERELEWNTMMTGAYASIIMSLSRDIYWEFVQFKDPRILMIKLKEKYLNSAGGTASYFRSLLANTSLIRLGNVATYVARLNQLISDIVHFGGTMENEERMFFLNSGLPEDWLYVSRIIAAHTNPTWEWAVQQLLEFEADERINFKLAPGADIFVDGLQNFTGRPVAGRKLKRVYFCSRCSRSGHSADKCWARRGDTAGRGTWFVGQRTPNKNVNFVPLGPRRTMTDTEENANHTTSRATKQNTESAATFQEWEQDLLR